MFSSFSTSKNKLTETFSNFPSRETHVLNELEFYALMKNQTKTRPREAINVN